MDIDLHDASGLRPNADTTHDSAREWYESYTWYLSTDDGDVSLQAVKYSWLGDLATAKTKLREKYPGLEDCEAEELVEQAASVRGAAEEIETELAAAVKAYEASDLDACVAALRRASDLEGDHGDDQAATALANALLYVGHWTILLSDDGGASEEIESNDQPTAEEAEQECREWYDGDCGAYGFGPEGARVVVSWAIIDPDGDEHSSGTVEIDIPPDHEALIRDEAGDRGCGTDPYDHDWTSEGEGGCDSNPGVWATGGTSMSFAHHCRACGLHRIKHTTGSQSNPGDHDTVEYDMPYEWCVRCQSDDHDDDDCPHQ